MSADLILIPLQMSLRDLIAQRVVAAQRVAANPGDQEAVKALAAIDQQVSSS